MCARRNRDREFGERQQRAAGVVAGAVMVLAAMLAWLVATLAAAGSTRLPMVVIVALSLVFGLVVGTVSRAIGSGPPGGWPGIMGRAAVAIAVGAVVGELAAVALFSGSIDRILDEQATRRADSVPAVAQATSGLERVRAARSALDDAVEQARLQRDDALVVARCEFHPTPPCPQTRITGTPGSGPETRTANQFLADAQRELDNALAIRDARVPALDAQIADDEQAVTRARHTAMADGDGGLGARWVAMNEYTLGSGGAMLLRLLTDVVFAMLVVLPLILRLWRGQTTQDRSAAARWERSRAELEADTAIAVKRAEVRAAAAIMWADQQLASARLAIEAQTEIDRERQRRRVIEEAAVRAAAVELPAGENGAHLTTPENLPAPAEPASAVEGRDDRGSFLPTIPDLTRTAVRWIRPFVPPIIASAIETTAKPLRAARHVLEETEEIDVTLKRRRRLTVYTEGDDELTGRWGSAATDAAEEPRWIEGRNRPGELRGPAGPRQLPPAQQSN